eukprot:TRINITY_DN74669_c0_g1_i1.p1 TRINITY_DN74669_c0_g1~~TRINITY_DN74669_c0_g1_i1.p1  ORF type:complete len:346 (-),score=30.89 TRINITY_DN74669_c0_g1_i1:42-1079(-)
MCTRSIPDVPRYECTEGGHNKFWFIHQKPGTNKVATWFGAIGNTPRGGVYKARGRSADEATLYLKKVVKSKQSEGYKLKSRSRSLESGRKEPVSNQSKSSSSRSSAGGLPNVERYECIDGAHRKFWMIAQRPGTNMVTTWYGRIGAKPRGGTYKPVGKTSADAEAYVRKTKLSKRKEGYRLAGAGLGAANGSSRKVESTKVVSSLAQVAFRALKAEWGKLSDVSDVSAAAAFDATTDKLPNDLEKMARKAYEVFLGKAGVKRKQDFLDNFGEESLERNASGKRVMAEFGEQADSHRYEYDNLKKTFCNGNSKLFLASIGDGEAFQGWCVTAIQDGFGFGLISMSD